MGGERGTDKESCDSIEIGREGRAYTMKNRSNFDVKSF